MTHEEFAHLCLQIKNGDTSVEIPCCANCEFCKRLEVFHIYSVVCTRKKPVGLYHGFAFMQCEPGDFCSHFLERKVINYG